MNGVFISYRREDSAPYAGRLCDHLRRTFPSASVFMDVDAVAPGADFVAAIDANLSGSGIVLAVIGPRWESATDLDGRRRIENPDDYVVRELATALQRQANVIPLLVGGAKMPSATTLPPSLGDLKRRNAVVISDESFGEDAERLCAAIARDLNMRHDDWKSGSRVEYSHFFSNAALAQARSRFRLVVWISYFLTALFILSSQFWRYTPQKTTTEIPAGVLPCGDASDPACRSLNAWFGLLIDLENSMENAAPTISIVLTVLVVGFWALVIQKLLRGKRWARLAFMVAGGAAALNLFGLIGALLTNMHSPRYIAQVFLSLGAVGAYAWAARMMYTEPVRRWFLRV